MKKINLTLVASSLILAVGAAGITHAAPGKGKGPLASIDVTNICSIEGADFVVRTTVEDVGDVPAVIESYSVTALARLRGQNTVEIGTLSLAEVPDQVAFSLCTAGGDPLDVLDGARALNADVEITLDSGRTFTSRCDDDPATEVDESDLSLEGFACPQP